MSYFITDTIWGVPEKKKKEKDTPSNNPSLIIKDPRIEPYHRSLIEPSSDPF